MSTVTGMPRYDDLADGGVPVLLSALVDDAAVFPPGDAPMSRALTDHVANRAAPWGELVGRFLCPASRLGELVPLVRALPPEADDIDLGIIADTGLDGLPAALAEVESEPRLCLALVAVGLSRTAPDLAAAAQEVVDALPDIEAYVEIPRAPGWTEALAIVADSMYGARLRTGGLDAAAFPDERAVAQWVLACVSRETPFTCTAGLHHAVRHRDDMTGFEHQGFLNVLLAVDAAVAGAGRDEIEAVLAQRDGSVLARRADRLDDVAATVARSFFVAFGSCSTTEPRDDLQALGLLGQSPKEG